MPDKKMTKSQARRQPLDQPSQKGKKAKSKGGKSFVEHQPEGVLKGTPFDYIPDAYQVSNWLKDVMSREKTTGNIDGIAQKGKTRGNK